MVYRFDIKFKAAAIVLISGLLFAGISPVHASTDISAGYGEEESCATTAPRAFHKESRTRVAISFSWRRPLELCDKTVGHYTLVIRKTRRGRGVFKKVIPARSRATIVREVSLSGRGHYEAHLFVRLNDGSKSPNSQKIRFVL